MRTTIPIEALSPESLRSNNRRERVKVEAAGIEPAQGSRRAFEIG